jgi:hypothetical protein
MQSSQGVRVLDAAQLDAIHYQLTDLATFLEHTACALLDILQRLQEVEVQPPYQEVYHACLQQAVSLCAFHDLGVQRIVRITRMLQSDAPLVAQTADTLLYGPQSHLLSITQTAVDAMLQEDPKD